MAGDDVFMFQERGPLHVGSEKLSETFSVPLHLAVSQLQFAACQSSFRVHFSDWTFVPRCHVEPV